MRVDVLTIFPGLFAPFLQEGMVRIAQEKRLLDVAVHNLRNWTHDVHKTVDDRPYGGGPGMVMKPEPVFEAVEAVEAGRVVSTPPGGAAPGQVARRIMLSPTGEPLTQGMLQELAQDPWLLLICGRYEGFDDRIRVGLAAEEVSIGDYVLAGGEVPAMVIIDGVSRLIPGVLGHADSPVSESFSDGLLEYPQYTRPLDFRGMRVPEVLLSGNHAEIARWRQEQALARTRERRQDLLVGRMISDQT